MLKRRIEEVEENLHKEEKTRATLEGEMKGLREQKETSEVSEMYRESQKF